MATRLEDAIQMANDPAHQFDVGVTLTMHDENDIVFFGSAVPTFRANLTPSGSLRRFPVPGFSTVGNPAPSPNLQENQFVASNRLTNVPPVQVQRFVYDQPLPINFTVLYQGLGFFSRFFHIPPIVTQIALLDTPGGNVVRQVDIGMEETGSVMRGFGPSLNDATVNATYAVTLDMVPIIG